MTRRPSGPPECLAPDFGISIVAGFPMPAPNVNVVSGDRIFCVTLEGSPGTSDIIATLERYYPLVGDRVLLWDMTKADLSGIRDAHFADIAAIAAVKLGPNEKRKTAYVVSDTPTYARLCKYMTAAFIAGVQSEYRVFLDIDAARDWLTNG